MIICQILTAPAPTHVAVTYANSQYSYVSSYTANSTNSSGAISQVVMPDFTTIIDPAVIKANAEFSDHAMFVRGFREKGNVVVNLGLGSDRLVNIYARTKAQRLTLDDYLHTNAYPLMMGVLVPYESSPVSEWILAIPVKDCTFVCSEPTVSCSDWSNFADTYMPRLRAMSHIRSGNIVVISYQCCASSLQPVANNPTLFFEVTSGVLITSRAPTTDGCIVDVSNLPAGTKVRVKAGFKYMSGISDYTFTV